MTSLPEQCTACGNGLTGDEMEHNLDCIDNNFGEWICHKCEMQNE